MGIQNGFVLKCQQMRRYYMRNVRIDNLSFQKFFYSFFDSCLACDCAHWILKIVRSVGYLE